MDLKETIKGLRQEIEFEKKNNPNDLNEIGWGMQKGILISVNDLEKILDLCEGNPANSENANCDIFDVVGSACWYCGKELKHNVCDNCNKINF